MCCCDDTTEGCRGGGGDIFFLNRRGPGNLTGWVLAWDKGDEWGCCCIFFEKRIRCWKKKSELRALESELEARRLETS